MLLMVSMVEATRVKKLPTKLQLYESGFVERGGVGRSELEFLDETFQGEY